MLATANLALFAFGLALSLLGTYLSKTKVPSQLKDDNPETEVTRGAYVNYVVGTQRVAPIIAYAGDPYTTVDLTGTARSGGKRQGTPEPGTTTYFVKLVHLVCVGPCARINRIFINGKLYGLGFDPLSVPSGSTVPIYGLDGSANIANVRVYYGVRGEPLDTIIDQEMGIGSTLPLVCKFVFDPLTLGEVRQSPVIEYEVTCYPLSSLTGSRPFFAESYLDDSQLTQYPIGSWATGPIGTRYIQTVNQNSGDRIGLIRVGDVIRFGGQACQALFGSNAEFAVVYNIIPFNVNGGNRYLIGEKVTDVADIDNPQLTGTGDYFCKIPSNQDSGANYAHVIEQLLFRPAPYGAGRDPDLFNIESLEEAGRTLEEEGLKCNFKVTDGDSVVSILASIFADIGMLCPLNPRTGKREFVLWRQRATVPEIPEELILPPLPERINKIGEQKANRYVFTFSQRTREFRSGTYPVDDDGTAQETDSISAVNIDVSSTTDFATARAIGKRRSNMELVKQAGANPTLNRNGALLMVGDSVRLSGEPFVYRVVATRPSFTDTKIAVKLLQDYVNQDTGVDRSGSLGGQREFLRLSSGVPESEEDTNEIAEGQGFPAQQELVPEDLQCRIFEPNALMVSKCQVALLRIRAHNRINDASIHISRDGSTYFSRRLSYGAVTGGTLGASISSATAGPISIELNILGPDFDTIALDLSTDSENYNLGRQLCVIGDEIFFVESFTKNSETTATLTGCLRGKYGTKLGDHTLGDEVYLLQAQMLDLIDDILIQPTKALYVKSQPRLGGAEIALTDISAKNVTLAGEAYRPFCVDNVRDPSDNQEYEAAGDLEIVWDWLEIQKFREGGLLEDAGDYVSSGTPEHDFIVEVYDATVTTLGYTETVSNTNELTVSNADLVSGFGSEPSSVVVRIRSLWNGYQSDNVDTTFTRV